MEKKTKMKNTCTIEKQTFYENPEKVYSGYAKNKCAQNLPY